MDKYLVGVVQYAALQNHHQHNHDHQMNHSSLHSSSGSAEQIVGRCGKVRLEIAAGSSCLPGAGGKEAPEQDDVWQ